MRPIRWGIVAGAALIAAYPARAQPTKVVCLGDSLTEGTGVNESAAWPALVEAELKKRGYSETKLVNAGVSGSTSASGLSRLRWQISGKPTHLILALGANDGLRGLGVDETKKNLADVLKLAKEKKLVVLLTGMKVPPNMGVDYASRFEAMFPALAKEHDVRLLPFLLEGVAGSPKLNLADGVHPNEEGHKIIAALIVKHLESLLTK